MASKREQDLEHGSSDTAENPKRARIEEEIVEKEKDEGSLTVDQHESGQNGDHSSTTTDTAFKSTDSSHTIQKQPNSEEKPIEDSQQSRSQTVGMTPDMMDAEVVLVASGNSKDSCDSKMEEEENGPIDGVSADKAQQPLLDPLSYTKAEEFTSEIFKIQIRNLPKFGFKELKNRLKSHLQLNPHKLKSDKRYVTYVCFRNETDRDEALQKINGHVWKGKTLEAKIAAPVADPFLQKRQQEQGVGSVTEKSSTQSTDTETDKQLTPQEAEARLRANVSPLWDTEYSEQLQMKTEKIKDVLQRVTKNNFVRHMFTDKSQHDGLACELLPIVPSPVTSEYRNKNEFTVGYGLDAQTVMVGFRYGMYKDGTTAVGDCTNLAIAMPAAIPVVKSFKEFVSKSQWLPFRQETATGHWQTLTVRTFQTGDVMAMADFVPRKLEQSEINLAKASLKEFYTSGEGKDVNITSFYFRVMGGKGQKVKPGSELLFGKPHVYESLLDLKFRISPEAFFQVNTAATEKLYQLIADWCDVSSSTTVLDICCGTGTIGLSMAKRVKDVIGIEMCRPAVEDAKVNASINGITNATFHCAKVEDVISKIMASVQSSSSTDVVAVVDPPRAGLHKDVIKTLRKCSEIQRLVYVSCNPDSALDNFVDIIRPETGRHKGCQFKMVKATPVDLFPGTRHCELVILFARSDLQDKTAHDAGDEGEEGDDKSTENTDKDEQADGTS